MPTPGPAKSATAPASTDSGTAPAPAPAVSTQAAVLAARPNPSAFVLPENTSTWTYQIRVTGALETPWVGRGTYAGALVYAANVVGGVAVANANTVSIGNDGKFASEQRIAGDTSPAVYGGDPAKRFDLGKICVVGTAGDYITIKWY